MANVKLKLRGIPVTLIDEGRSYVAQFKFNRPAMEELKSMFGATWVQDRKVWRVNKSEHTRVQIEFCNGMNPFPEYSKKLIEHRYSRPLLPHQVWMADSILTYHNMLCIFEMGLGKSLTALSAAEVCEAKNIWLIGPISALKSVELELIKWKFDLSITLMTYNKITSLMKSGVKDTDLPDFLICDESSSVKTHSSQRTKAVLELVKKMRKYNPESYTVLMTGTPAPKSPVDYFSQMKIVADGFLKEANPKKFGDRLAKSILAPKGDGEMFNKHLFWLDDETRCNHCGKGPDEMHLSHDYEPSINEVANLYKRMTGPAIVMLKKDAVDLPEKIFELIELKPTLPMLKDIKAIKNSDLGAPQMATMMQEISDGFLYVDTPDGMETCTRCGGDLVDWDPDTEEEIECEKCNGTGEQTRYIRTTDIKKTPKDQAIILQLEQHEDIGRLVIWAGFKASINRLVDICLKKKWTVLRADGEGFRGIAPDGSHPPVSVLLATMDKSNTEFDDQYDKVVFVGNPMASSMGITLTKSPTAVYFSNSYNAQARMQSVDRIHRLGITFSPRIVDIVCLPIDRLVLANLEKKKDLQDLTLEELKEC